ncbi:MAG: phosphotransferase, partial [Kiloniellales bacterium]
VGLLHNDYKLDNVMVDGADPARPTAVLDWDMCTRGDPLMDLGYLLNFWVEAGDDPAWFEAAAMPTWYEGFPTRQQAIERYGRQTGFDLERIRWYQVFGAFKLAVVLQQIYIRYVRGQTQDRRFAHLDRRVAALADKAAVLAE